MAKARYNNGSAIVELPILAPTAERPKKDNILHLGHPEGIERPEGAGELKVGFCPIQAEGDLKPGHCRPFSEAAAAEEPADKQESDSAQTAVGSEAPPKGKKTK